MFANEYLRNVFVTIADMSANPNKEWSVKTVPIKLEWFFDDYFSNEISYPKSFCSKTLATYLILISCQQIMPRELMPKMQHDRELFVLIRV